METESTPATIQGGKKTNESPKKWENSSVVNHIFGGEEGEKVQLFLFGFWCFFCDFLRKIGMGDMSLPFLVNMNRMMFFLSFVVEPLRINR